MRKQTITLDANTIRALAKTTMPKRLINKLSKHIRQEIELSDLFQKSSELFATKSFIQDVFKYSQHKNSGASVKALQYDGAKTLGIGFESKGLCKLTLPTYEFVPVVVHPSSGLLVNGKILSLCCANKKLCKAFKKYFGVLPIDYVKISDQEKA